MNRAEISGAIDLDLDTVEELRRRRLAPPPRADRAWVAPLLFRGPAAVPPSPPAGCVRTHLPPNATPLTLAPPGRGLPRALLFLLVLLAASWLAAWACLVVETVRTLLGRRAGL